MGGSQETFAKKEREKKRAMKKRQKLAKKEAIAIGVPFEINDILDSFFLEQFYIIAFFHYFS